ncbi:MAG: DUF362 domain-containing protein [Endomicrobiia bacterium]
MNNKFFTKKFSRKSFLKLLASILSVIIFNKKKDFNLFASSEKVLYPRKKSVVVTEYDLVVVKGKEISSMVKKSIELLGGMSKFVKRGDVVVIKPNISWDRTPQYAANTNPEVVATIIKLCFESGAKIVKVFDNTCNVAQKCYKNSGIYDAVKSAGGTIFYLSDWQFNKTKFPPGSLMKDWPLVKDAIECDCFINVPIAKHHSLTKLTLSMKNLMGVCGGFRSMIHSNIDQKLVELTKFVNPDLTIIDAYRILVRNGPSGGNLYDVEEKNTIISSCDPVLADAYASTLFNIEPKEIGCIRLGHQMGLGNMDLKKAKIKFVSI